MVGIQLQQVVQLMFVILRLNSYNISIPVDETYTLKAFTLPTKAKTNVTYTSSDDNIASVDSKGVIKLKLLANVKLLLQLKQVCLRL